MSNDKSPGGHTHDASDRALDKLATAEHEADRTSKGPHYDPAEIAKHNDTGRDRLFEGRQQHDEADKNSEKNRLARDVHRHGHDVNDQVADSGTGPSAKQKT